MAYDKGLAYRIREQLKHRKDVEDKKMFGSLCFMVSNHMCCGIVGDKLLARVGPDNYKSSLAKPYVKEMDFTGKPMWEMVYVEANGISRDQELKEWVAISTNFIDSLPPKK